MSSLAAVFRQPGGLQLERLATPVPASGEVLVRVLGCTLCGSDLHTYQGKRTTPTPTVLGHEIVGEIESVGGDAPLMDLESRLLQPGDRITWAVVTHCGDCFYCRHDLPQKCERAVKYGHEAMREGKQLLGGLAEHCVLASGASIVKLPQELPLEVACPASCGTATVAAALEAAGDVAEQTVCVLGVGLLGLTACAMFREAGALVVAVDPIESRRDWARRFGAAATVEPAGLAPCLKEITAGRGADVVVELSGSAAAWRTTWPLTRLGGRWVLVGAVFPGQEITAPMDAIVRRNLSIQGVHNYAPRHLRNAVQFLSRHHLDYPFQELVAAWRPLSQAEAAFADAARPNVIRVGVKP